MIDAEVAWERLRRVHAVAFLDINVDAVAEAAAAAAASTKRYEHGEQLGLMDGVPLAVKDEVDVDGCRLRFGTGMEWNGMDNA